MRFSCLFLALFLFACQEAKQQPETANDTMPNEIEIVNSSPEDFDWQGHRGARGLAPENTVAGFMRALDFPAITTLELDLVVSKDESLVVSHEPWMSAEICTDQEGKPIAKDQARSYNIYEMDYLQVSAFDCGKKGNERFPEQATFSAIKPRLLDVAKVVEQQMAKKNRPAIRYNIEIKTTPEGDGIFHPTPEKFATLLIDELNRLTIKDRATIQSFDVRALQAAHRIDPSISLAFLVEEASDLEENLKILGFTPNIYSPYHQLVDEKMIRQAEAKSIKVIPWTVNDPERMKVLMELGVNGIITDYPNRIAQVLQDS